MAKIIYRWEWINNDGSQRRVEISTFHGKEVARQRALSTFPFSTDPVARSFISNNDPIELLDEN